jgi:hypothetical protein
MSSLREKIYKLESRLQALIEDGTARVFSVGDQQTDFFSGIMASMRSGIRTEETGRTIAPDIFILVVHPETAQLIDEHHALLRDISELVERAGRNAGFEFLNMPRIKILTDPANEPGEVEILYQFSLQEIDETSTITMDYTEAKLAPENAFLILEGKQIYSLTQQVVNIGRRVDNHVVLDDPRVSRLHAQIRAIDGRYVIFDLDSSGGTYVNGVRLKQTTLYAGDVISLAGVDLVYGQDETNLVNDDQSSTQPLVPST